MGHGRRKGGLKSARKRFSQARPSTCCSPSSAVRRRTRTSPPSNDTTFAAGFVVLLTYYRSPITTHRSTFHRFRASVQIYPRTILSTPGTSGYRLSYKRVAPTKVVPSKPPDQRNIGKKMRKKKKVAKRMETRGIDPRTSRMRSERSTI